MTGRVQLATDVQYLSSILATLGAQGLQRLQVLKRVCTGLF